MKLKQTETDQSIKKNDEKYKSDNSKILEALGSV